MDLLWGQRVASADAWGGSLAGALVAPDTHRATHLIVKRGLAFSKRFVVPINHLDHYDGEGIYLNLTISQMLNLPELRRGDIEPNLAARTPHTEIRLADGGKLALKGLRFDEQVRLLTHFIVSYPDLGNLLLPAETATEFSSSYVNVNIGNAALKELPVYRRDSSIESDLWDALYQSEYVPEVDISGIRAGVVGGVITLSGNVRTACASAAAERLARAVSGCVAVINEIASDWEIDLAIASLISHEMPGLSGSITINAQLGTVHLRGSVSSIEEREALIRAAKSIAGVRGLDDLVEMRPPLPVVADEAVSLKEDVTSPS